MRKWGKYYQFFCFDNYDYKYYTRLCEDLKKRSEKYRKDD